MHIVLLIVIALTCLSAAILGATINSYVIYKTTMDRRHVESAAIVFVCAVCWVLVAWSLARGAFEVVIP